VFVRHDHVHGAIICKCNWIAALIPALLLTVSQSIAQEGRATAGPAQPCAAGNGGITLPTSFCATVFADNDEELVQLEPGADYGWPRCHYDRYQGKRVLVCRQASQSGGLPGHWAPSDPVINLGHQFPAAYRGGTFIAFHGLWNRAPFPQGGYNVVFQPLADGKAAGPFVMFADGFAGAIKEPGQAARRPSGLAVDPDGALDRTTSTDGFGA
jgi:hypothetical protein